MEVKDAEEMCDAPSNAMIHHMRSDSKQKYRHMSQDPRRRSITCHFIENQQILTENVTNSNLFDALLLLRLQHAYNREMFQISVYSPQLSRWTILLILLFQV